MGEDFGARPLFRVVVIRSMPKLLELNEGVCDRPQMAYRGVMGIGELFAARFSAGIVHLAMLEGASQSGSLARLFPVSNRGGSEEMEQRVVGR